MVNSKPSFGRQVCRRCLSSVVDLHLRCGPAQHRPFACTLPQTYREKNFKLLPSICLKFIQHISTRYYRVCYCCLTNIFRVHLKNTAFRQYTRVTRLKRFSTLENSAQHTTNQIKDNEVFMNNIAWSHLLVWTHWSRWRRSSRFFPRFPLTASSSFLYGLDPDLQFWRVAI